MLRSTLSIASVFVAWGLAGYLLERLVASGALGHFGLLSRELAFEDTRAKILVAVAGILSVVLVILMMLVKHSIAYWFHLLVAVACVLLASLDAVQRGLSPDTLLNVI